jgi:hypothetical protein
MARAKGSELAERCIEIARLHANNRFLIYSDVFEGNLENTFAGNAFASLRFASFGFELIRLTALWDSPAKDRVSIPDIIALIDHPEVQERLKADFDEWYGQEGNLLRGDWNTRRFYRRWRHAVTLGKAIIASGRLRSLKAHRDKFLAHNLTTPTKGTPKFGYERKMLLTTYRVAAALTTALEDKALDYANSHDISRRHANEFWLGLKWTPPDRELVRRTQ